MLGQNRPEKTQWNVIRSGEIPSPRQTSIDKSNDCVMNSYRGTLVGGSDPPSGHSVHNTAGGTRRAPAGVWHKTICPPVCRNRRQQLSVPLRRKKRDPFSGLGGERKTPRETSHLLDHRSPSYWKLPSMFVGHAPHTPNWLAVGWFCVEIEGLSSRELFLIGVLTISHVKAGFRHVQPQKKKKICPQWRYKRILNRLIFE